MTDGAPAAATQAWLDEIAGLADGGDPRAALDACDRAIAAWPDIGQAYRLRYRLAETLGDRDQMIAALRQLVRHDPDDVSSCARLGGLLCDHGDFAGAVAVLAPLAARHGDAGDVAARYCAALAATGAYAELRAMRPLLDRLAASAARPYPPYAPLAMARLAGVADPAQTRSAMAALQRSPRWLDADRTEAALVAAIADGTPFSLLRLDGAVARFAALCGANARRLLRPEERLAALDGVWGGWFGGSSQVIAPAALSELQQAFLAAIDAADIVAIPGVEAMEREPQHFGYLAELGRVLRAGTGARFAGADVALQLHRSNPYLRALLGGLPFLGFVGAHAGMFRKLAQFSAVPATAIHLVPDAADSPAVARGPDPAGFLPDGHQAVLSAIAVPHRGAVFLVAAPGPLGAVYAGRIKALGGIAIEIGPLARQWAA